MDISRTGRRDDGQTETSGPGVRGWTDRYQRNGGGGYGQRDVSRTGWGGGRSDGRQQNVRTSRWTSVEQGRMDGRAEGRQWNWRKTDKSAFPERETDRDLQNEKVRYINRMK